MTRHLVIACKMCYDGKKIVRNQPCWNCGGRYSTRREDVRIISIMILMGLFAIALSFFLLWLALK